MKKTVSIFLSFLIICGLLSISGCGKAESFKKSDGKISVVTTIFPYYDFVRQLAGDKADIRLLLSPGSDPHSYEPTPSDIVAIENCDIFIYNGGESDEWVDGVLSSIENKKLCLSDLKKQWITATYTAGMKIWTIMTRVMTTKKGRSMTSMSGLQSEMQSVCLPQLLTS